MFFLLNFSFHARIYLLCKMLFFAQFWFLRKCTNNCVQLYAKLSACDAEQCGILRKSYSASCAQMMRKSSQTREIVQSLRTKIANTLKPIMGYQRINGTKWDWNPWEGDILEMSAKDTPFKNVHVCVDVHYYISLYMRTWFV